MSYSVSTPIKNKKLQKKMLDFLEKHYHHPERLIYASEPRTELDYDEGQIIIGFDYKVSEEDRAWAHAVSKWIATKVGKAKTFDGISEPYLRYDGMELIPVSKTHFEDTLPPDLKDELSKLSAAWESSAHTVV